MSEVVLIGKAGRLTLSTESRPHVRVCVNRQKDAGYHAPAFETGSFLLLRADELCLWGGQRPGPAQAVPSALQSEAEYSGSGRGRR